MSMCWCRDCKYYEDKYCLKPRSDNYMEMIGDCNSCKYSEMNEEARAAEYDKGYTDGFWAAKKNVR